MAKNQAISNPLPPSARLASHPQPRPRAGIASVRCQLLPWSELPSFAQRHAEKILTVIGFGTGPMVEPPPYPYIGVELTQVGTVPLVEAWTASDPVVTGATSAVRFASAGEFLFGELRLAEAHEGIAATTRRAYLEILATMQDQRFPHLLRMWNYLPAINETRGDIERYRLFSVGRYQAFAEHYKATVPTPPAASAVGTHAGPLQICFLAARTTGVNVENPRQISAYHYPPVYGPRSPSFSRATLHKVGSETRVYISGTASIVGHETRHPGDVGAQVEETLRNLSALLANLPKHDQAYWNGVHDLESLKVYIRNRHDFALVKDLMDRHVGATVPTLYLTGDICRRDLLLEIEAIASHGHQQQ